MNRKYLGEDDDDMKSLSSHASSHHYVINQWNSNSAIINCSLKSFYCLDNPKKDILNTINANIQHTYMTKSVFSIYSMYVFKFLFEQI